MTGQSGPYAQGFREGWHSAWAWEKRHWWLFPLPLIGWWLLFQYVIGWPT